MGELFPGAHALPERAVHRRDPLGHRAAEEKRPPQQAMVLERWLATLYASFQDRIVPISPGIAEAWGRLRSERPLATADALIAATAKVHGWSVVTRNVKDFDGLGVTVVNPFDWPV
ncbi:PIN domain-containing protein [Nonomuraea ferruginea]